MLSANNKEYILLKEVIPVIASKCIFIFASDGYQIFLFLIPVYALISLSTTIHTLATKSCWFLIIKFSFSINIYRLYLGAIKEHKVAYLSLITMKLNELSMYQL